MIWRSLICGVCCFTLTTLAAQAQSDDDDVAQVADEAGVSVNVRLTYYVEYGWTASGGKTYPGSTACSYNFSFGTRFRLPDGEIVTCNDRGHLGSSGWLDLWRRPDLAHRYGPFTTVEVLP